MAHDVSRDLDALAGRRVFFGHQSVGSNILDGVRALAEQAGRPARIVEYGGADPGSETGGVLLHAKVGRNEQPLTKLDAFRELLAGGLAERIDVALVKFCYIDINERTDVEALFNRYHQTLDELARRHPAVTFIPVTAPLRHAPSGLGVLARELLGRPNRSKRDNLARHRFNQRLRAAYAGRPLFDLAAVQATHPNGRHETFRQQGQEAEALVAGYTDDGGHLNAAGREVVARAFLRSLAAAADRQV